MNHDRPLPRRRFLQQLGGITAATLFPIRSHADAGEPILKAIPGSGEQLPVIGMGTSRTFDTAHDEAMSVLGEVLRAFFDRGGRVIDSSPMYGASERVLGELLAGVNPPADLFAATKVWTNGRQAGVEQMEQSRRLWGIERFDLIQIHNLRDWQVHLETLSTMKADGQTRYIGVTTSHGRNHAELESLLSRHPFDFVQLSYNIADRTVEQRLLPLARERKIAVIVNRPFARGNLFRAVKGKSLPDWAAQIDCASWAQFFLKYGVSHPAVTCAIPATSKLSHMVDNMAAGFGRLPDAAMRTRMENLVENL